jgi:hypothetical protein
MGKDISRAIKRMESNFPAKKYKKGTPAQLRLSFEMDGGGTQYIDIAKALSIINRKMYRQGCYYYVNSVEYYDNDNSTVNLHVLPDTWVTRAAYRRAKALFDELNIRALETIGSGLPGTYHDFRVYMDNRHRLQATSVNPALHTINDNYNEIVADDWDYSQFVTADKKDGVAPADEFNAHMLGPTVSTGSGATSDVESVGIIESYKKTRATVQSDNPNMVNLDLADPLLNIFDYSSEEVQNDVINNMNSANDEPPYNLDQYVGEAAGHLQHVARLVTSTEVGRVTYGPGFCAPLGLICVDPLESVTTPYRIVLNLLQGTYNGVYAERMA